MVGMSDSSVHAVAGAAGGCIAMAVTYPLVNLSTRSQVEAKSKKESTRSAALKVIQRDGIAGLYDGLSSSLLGIAVTNGIYYLCFEEARAVVLKSRKGTRATLSTLESILVSAFAGAATSVLSNPIWVVNTRQTVRTTVASDPTAPAGKKVIEKRRTIWQTIIDILRTDGPAAFFHGLGPALILVSNPILQFTLFEQLKNFILRRRALRLTKGNANAPPLTDLDFFLLGAVTKLFATSVTYPYLTVKARMQAGNAEGKSYTSSLDGLRKIIAREGPQGLYKGIAPKLTQSVATAALLFLAKEKIYNATRKALIGTVAKNAAKA
ncbi:RHTO0S02e04610g1_1 [Rhodotorula toruloides]|uniref:RHTO0S02e04610g1_1 n=2 Tax=Rhodotorula toruloides TaxID=5286 RepID=A0A061AGC0_RHOTO|nr:peroxisomal membrane protein Pmp47 [Rhodotorula toruloides NP11]EMS21951.1 peroxisomal membrane protein Pmp47 [Rhodotorula toruloides NP11]CDR36618.1 RHTO0S02e04610g1_1 [Rhodotorula toruloides]